METTNKKLTMADVERMNAAAGFYFFSTDTMEYFNCRIESELFDNLTFVTSERDKGFRGPDGHLYRAWDGKRRYTVRRFNPDTCFIETVSEFGEFASAKSAARACENYGITWKA